MKLYHRATLPWRYEKGTASQYIAVDDSGFFVVSTDGSSIVVQLLGGDTFKINLLPHTDNRVTDDKSLIETKVAYGIRYLSISEDCHRLVRCDYGETIRLYEIDDPIRSSLGGRHVTEISPARSVSCDMCLCDLVGFSPSLRYAVFTKDDRSVIYDAHSGSKVDTFSLGNLIFSRDESVLLSSSIVHITASVNLKSPTRLLRLMRCGRTMERCHVLDVSRDMILIWRFDRGKKQHKISTVCLHTGRVEDMKKSEGHRNIGSVSARFTSCGRYVVAVYDVRTSDIPYQQVVLFELESYRPVDGWLNNNLSDCGPATISISPSGRRVAVISWDGCCHMFEITD